MATGEAVGRTKERHRHQEVLKLRRPLEKAVPKDRQIHIILDNYATHKPPRVLDWIEHQKRTFLHFALTSASWLNLVERFLGAPTERQLSRGVFPSAKDPERSLKDYIRTCNENPRLLAWTKTANETVKQVGRARQASAAAFA